MLGKKFLTDTGGYTNAAAALTTFWMMLLCMLSTSASGFISRLVGNRRKPLIIAGACLTIMALLWLSASLLFQSLAPWRHIGFYIIAPASSVPPLVSSLIKEVNPPESAATSVGLANCLCYLQIAVLGNLAGIVLDAFGGTSPGAGAPVVYPHSAYLCLLMILLALAACSLWAATHIRETRGVSVYTPRERPRAS